LFKKLKLGFLSDNAISLKQKIPFHYGNRAGNMDSVEPPFAGPFSFNKTLKLI
jgi:hypothetical protein